MPESQRPYERFHEMGPFSLSDQELLAIIIGSGSKGKNALALASSVISILANEEGLPQLNDASIEELMGISGIGVSKAIKIKAALEIGRRANNIKLKKKTKLSSPEKIANYFAPRIDNIPREELHVVFLDRKNALIKELLLSKGGLSTTVIDPRDVFREAIKANAAAFVLVHNHPSGDPTPSRDDISTTMRFQEAGNFLGIHLHDHIIIGKGKYISMFSDALYSDIFQSTST